MIENFIFSLLIWFVIVVFIFIGLGKLYFKVTDRVLFKDLTEWNKKRRRKK